MESAPNMQLDKVIECLNDAWRRDPLAMRTFLINTIPCNQALADHPTVIVDQYEDGYVVRTMGLLNGCLEAAGIGRVAASFSSEADSEGKRKFLGFTWYRYPESQ